MLFQQPRGEGFVAEHVLRAGLAVVEVAAHAPHLHVLAALGGHLLELDVAHAAVGVHDADGHALGVAEALERRLAGVARRGHEDHEVVVELALLAQLRGARREELRQALQRHVLERARGAVPQLQHVGVAVSEVMGQMRSSSKLSP